MLNQLTRIPNWLVSSIANHPVFTFLLSVASIGGLCVLVGLWMGSLRCLV